MEDEEEFVSWYRALAENPDYYTSTEQGQKELADMIRKESERLIEQLGKTVKRTKEIVWLSKYCSECQHFLKEGQKMTCNRWSVRIVKPFYGRAIWVSSSKFGDEKEMVVEGIDWDSKWKEISDKIVERAIELVNGGYPYFCYTSR